MIGLRSDLIARAGIGYVSELLAEIAGRSVAILLVEQTLTIAPKVSQRLYVMGHGQIVFEGPPGGSGGEPAGP
jgi:branched-chain amino acid transport system ATP-binding protein